MFFFLYQLLFCNWINKCIFLLTELLFISLFRYQESMVSLVIKYLLQICYLCICQQLDSSDLFKSHGLASHGGESTNLATVGGLAQVGDKVKKLGFQKCEDTLSMLVLQPCKKIILIFKIAVLCFGWPRLGPKVFQFIWLFIHELK